MDPILSGYISDFLNRQGIETQGQGPDFDRFATHCIVVRDFPSVTDSSEIIVDGQSDTGLDGVAVFANGIHLTDISTLNFLTGHTRASIDFVFIQSKSGAKISAADIGSFGEGVVNFFDDTGMRQNDRIAELKQLKQEVFKKAAKFAHKPKVHLYFCTATSYQGDQDIDARANSVIKRLRALNIFADISFLFLNRDRLTTRYDEIRLKIEREVIFDRHAVFPEIDGIRQAYLGLLPCKEYLKMITNSDGQIQRNLFSENVRDYLGDNKVNLEIQETLQDERSQPKLPAMNNGITVVAKEISNVGNRFVIRDFQIVNGCQTSNVIFQNRDRISDDTYIPVRFIEVSSQDLISDIVRSTNRQTQVTDEAFVALEEFHKNLEKFFLAVQAPDQHRIYYERRRNQYLDDNIAYKKVISLTALTKSFIACYIGEPHSTNRYFGELIEANKERLFVNGHSNWIYYTCAAVFHRVDTHERMNRQESRWLRQYKYQAAFLILLQFRGLPDLFSNRKMDEFCNRVLKLLWDEGRFNQALQDTIEIITQCSRKYGKEYLRNPPFRLKQFTSEIMDASSQLHGRF